MLVCLMAFSAGLTSCSDDDENFDSSMLVGRWEIVRSEGFYYMPDGERESYDDPVYGEYVEFFEDGTVVSGSESGSWSLSGNRLSLTVYGERETYTVATLNATELVLEMSGRDEDGEYFDRTTCRRAD